MFQKDAVLFGKARKDAVSDNIFMFSLLRKSLLIVMMHTWKNCIKMHSMKRCIFKLMDFLNDTMFENVFDIISAENQNITWTQQEEMIWMLLIFYNQ